MGEKGKQTLKSSLGSMPVEQVSSVNTSQISLKIAALCSLFKGLLMDHFFVSLPDKTDMSAFGFLQGSLKKMQIVLHRNARRLKESAIKSQNLPIFIVYPKRTRNRK